MKIEGDRFIVCTVHGDENIEKVKSFLESIKDIRQVEELSEDQEKLLAEEARQRYLDECLILGV